LPLLSVAGASKLYALPGLGYDDVIRSIGGVLATAMFLLFTIARLRQPVSARSLRATASRR